MTENVLKNIFESLSLDDAVAADAQITEWFDTISQVNESVHPTYVLEHEMFVESAAAWGFQSSDDAETFVHLYENGGGDFAVRIIDASEAPNHPTTLAPVGCFEGVAADDLAVWMQEYGAEGVGYAVLTTIEEGLRVIPQRLRDPGREDDRFDVEDEETGKIVGMGMGKDYADNFAKHHGRLGPIGENVNTTRRCGECGEIDAAMDEDAEFCDQCIQEANSANPDLVNTDADKMINVKDIKWDPMAESIDPALADLMEQFKGFTVVDALSNKEGAQVGNADSIKVNTDSPTPNIKASKRVGGAPVEIKATEHKGFDSETAPVVADAKVNEPAPKAERKEVPDGGDKSALLNKEEGKGNDISPIGSKSRKS